MEEYNTFESITEAFRQFALKKEVVPPEKWLAGAVKLNILMGTEQEKLVELKHIVSKMKKQLLTQGNTAVYTNMVIDASDENREVKLLEARIINAKETIMLAKKFSTMSIELMKNNL